MREKIARFMAGRNGNDQLNRFLLLVDIVLLLIAAIFKDGIGRYVYPLVFVLLALIPISLAKHGDNRPEAPKSKLEAFDVDD